MGMSGDMIGACQVLESWLLSGTCILGDTVRECQVLELRLMAGMGMLGDTAGGVLSSRAMAN